MGRLFDITNEAADAGRRKDWDALASYYAEDVTAWAPTYEVTGRAAFIEVGKAQNDQLQDIRYEATLVVETEDTVVVEWIWSIPHPSGTGRASLKGLSYNIFDGDRMKTVHQYWDSTSFMQQLEAGVGAG